MLIVKNCLISCRILYDEVHSKEFNTYEFNICKYIINEIFSWFHIIYNTKTYIHFHIIHKMEHIYEQLSDVTYDIYNKVNLVSSIKL